MLGALTLVLAKGAQSPSLPFSQLRSNLNVRRRQGQAGRFEQPQDVFAAPELRPRCPGFRSRPSRGSPWRVGRTFPTPSGPTAQRGRLGPGPLPKTPRSFAFIGRPGPGTKAKGEASFILPLPRRAFPPDPRPAGFSAPREWRGTVLHLPHPGRRRGRPRRPCGSQAPVPLLRASALLPSGRAPPPALPAQLPGRSSAAPPGYAQPAAPGDPAAPSSVRNLLLVELEKLWRDGKRQKSRGPFPWAEAPVNTGRSCLPGAVPSRRGPSAHRLRGPAGIQL